MLFYGDRTVVLVVECGLSMTISRVAIFMGDLIVSFILITTFPRVLN